MFVAFEAKNSKGELLVNVGETEANVNKIIAGLFAHRLLGYKVVHIHQAAIS